RQSAEAVTLRFFFSSRRRHRRSKRDWSSDVCSSDLPGLPLTGRAFLPAAFLYSPRLSVHACTSASDAPERNPCPSSQSPVPARQIGRASCRGGGETGAGAGEGETKYVAGGRRNSTQ